MSLLTRMYSEFRLADDEPAPEDVAFVPGAPFYCQNPDHSTLRFSFATVGEDKILEGVDRLKQAMNASA
jgi:DNA-binding transcriptional MocR family regulator